MSWSNYHGHCHYCDGKGKPEEYIERAIDLKMPVLGISCHAPVPFETTWTMPAEKLPVYLDEMTALKTQFQDKISLLTSLEVDYIPGLAGPLHPQILNANLDYVVGSVHYVESFETGIHWSIDNNNTEFESGLIEIFGNDIRKALKRYFIFQQEMCANQTPDILGHMDKIKMHNLVKPHFSEESSWYLQMVYDTMKLAAEKEIIVEINTKYFDRSGILFPGKEHYKWMKENGVRVTINSDAHRPDALTSGFEEVAILLKNAGYKELWASSGNGFIPRGFNSNGIIW
jgi:histidinol-phosphatase (PHP family)